VELTDQELLNLAMDGDGGAFALLVGRYEIPLRSYFRRRRVADQDSLDLLQETFTRVFRYAASYDPAKRLGSWIFTIASNLFKDRFQRLSRRSALETAVDPSTLEGVCQQRMLAPEAAALQAEMREEIMTAVGELSDEHRAVFMLKHYYGLRYQEIGRLLGCSVGTVKSRMHYACRKLQGSLSGVGLSREGGRAGAL
jgi:RNA polymerase sigma-70 factor (ECF subfamily)